MTTTTPSAEVLFPDAIAVLHTYLTGVLTEPVVHEVPANRPATFVQVRRTGGVSRDVVIDGAFVTVDSWAATPPAAMQLAQLVRSKLRMLQGGVADGVAVYRVRELAGPSDFPDEESGSPRVRQSFQIGLRGQEVSN